MMGRPREPSLDQSGADLAGALLDFVEDKLARLQASYAPGLELPRVFAGHPVGPDAHADVAYTLSFLHQAGRPGYEDVIRRILATIDGPNTHTFYSYRVAESVLALGGIEALPAEQHPNLLDAADSSASLPALEAGRLPPNYAAVLGRCENARAALGVEIDLAALDGLLERLRAMFTANSSGFIDDGADGEGRFDIYSPDTYLFAEPLAERLGGDVWSTGFAKVLDIVVRLAARNGAAITWGRSIGALSVCMTIELASAGVAHGLLDGAGRSRWLSLASNAARQLDGWFAPTGLINAHQHRSTFRYRGPHRRLQMTFDCLGKIAAAGLALQRAGVLVSPASDDPAWGDRDDVIAFADTTPTAAVWTYRTPSLAFVLPLVGSAIGDYLPAPRSPGTFEVPVDRPQYAGVPVAWHRGRVYVPAGIPADIEHAPGRLAVTHAGWQPAIQIGQPSDRAALAGERRATYTAEGRTLSVDETLRFDGELPEVVALQIAEARGRPLRVDVTSDQPHRQIAIDTAGMTEWRSFWGELPVVHQIDVDPAASMRFRWSVTPKLRVMTNARRAPYHRGIYDQLVDRVFEPSFPGYLMRDANAERLVAALRDVDQFHLHWPEWLALDDVGTHRRVIESLRAAGVRIVWTQHNRLPHSVANCEGVYPVYQEWADAADGVIHHSDWGRAVMTSTYRFRPDAIQRVIPHSHWGPIMDDFDAIDRREAEAELGLSPCRLRLGVIGAPRPGKDVQLVLDAFARSRRDDVQLLVTSLSGTERVPDDPRIHAIPYVNEDRDVYNRRLRTIDALVLPFAPDQMLTTGTVGDVVAAGIPALTSDWPYLAEALGDAAIPYGQDLTACIDALDDTTLAAAAAASRNLQKTYDPAALADETFALLEAVGTSKI